MKQIFLNDGIRQEGSMKLEIIYLKQYQHLEIVNYQPKVTKITHIYNNPLFSFLFFFILVYLLNSRLL